MTTEIQTTDTFDVSDQPPVLLVQDDGAETTDAKPPEKKKSAPAKAKDVKDDVETGGAAQRPIKDSRDIRAISLAEDASLRDILEALGSDGAFKIKVTRVEPTEHPDPITGKRVKVDGHLKDYVTKIDEETIQKNHGGGRFKLRIMNRRPDGSLGFFKERTIDVAGDPRLDDIPRTIPAPNAPAAPVAASSGESPNVVGKALEMMDRQLQRAQEQPAAGFDSKPYELMIAQLQSTIASMGAQMEAVRKEATEARNAKPETDPFRDKLLDKMLDGDNARIVALRTQHESEIRMLKESHNDDVKRLNDRFDRMMADLKASFEREISATRSMNDLVRQTVQTSGDTAKSVLEAQIRALEREVKELRDDNKELREKKDKSPLEMLKDAKALKDLISDDDGGDEKGTIGQIMEALPEMMPAIGGLFGKGPNGQPAAAPAQAQAIVAQPRRVVGGPNGRKFVVQGDRVLKEVTPKAAPGEPQIPHIAPEQSAQILNFLERAFEGGQEPETVAQSIRTMLAGREEIFTAVRALGGVDVFLMKVANLPSTSPLASQAGKNWTRKLSKLLVGE